MYGSLLNVGAELIARYGLVVLLVVFALEGALVGKLIPTRALFVATVLAIGTDAVGLASVALVAVIGATLGQFVLFAFVKQTDVTVEDLPGPVETTAGERVERWFDRWGLPAIALTNALPVARGSLTVPAAMTDEGAIRFSASSLVGTSMYAVGLLGVAVGLEAAIAFV